jgi:hypothetical protein
VYLAALRYGGSQLRREQQLRRVTGKTSTPQLGSYLREERGARMRRKSLRRIDQRPESPGIPLSLATNCIITATYMRVDGCEQRGRSTGKTNPNPRRQNLRETIEAKHMASLLQICLLQSEVRRVPWRLAVVQIEIRVICEE